MRHLLQALFCFVLILGAAACAAPTDGPQTKEPHSVNNHIPPPGFLPLRQLNPMSVIAAAFAKALPPFVMNPANIATVR